MKDYSIIHPPQPKKPKSSGSGSAAIANPKEDIDTKPVTAQAAMNKTSSAKPGTREIQIFTDESLEHNKKNG